MRHTHRDRQRGVVLIAVVWSVFILAAMAFGLATLARSGSEELHARKEHLQDFYLARGAIYRSLPALKQLTAQDMSALAEGQPIFEWDEAGSHVRVDATDEGGKLDLNAASPQVLEKLFVNVGYDAMAAHNLVAAIEDWRDADDETRLGGAESLYYLSLPQPYRPADRDFRSVEELLLVRGVTPDIFYGGYVVRRDGAVEHRLGLVDCLTVATHTAQVNLNYAPVPVLLAIPGMDPTLVQYILLARQRKLLASVEEFTRNYPVLVGGETLSALTAGSSGVYTLVASSTTSSGVKASVRALVRVKGLDLPADPTTGAGARQGPPFLILDWDDDYVR